MSVKSKGTDEGEEFNIFDEYEDFETDDEELDNEGSEDDDEEFSLEALTPKERKRYEKMREEVENAVVAAIAQGDTKSEVYKGLQRVLAKRDRELEEARNALGHLIGRVSNVENNDNNEFLMNIFKEMLNDQDKQVFEEKFQSHKNQKAQAQQQEVLAQLVQQQQAQRLGYTRYGEEEANEELVQYRKQATDKLKAFAKKMGVDPNSRELDYGDEMEPLLTRMDKLSASIEKVQEGNDEEDIKSVRRKVNAPKTKTDTGPRGTVGTDILERGTREMLAALRKL